MRITGGQKKGFYLASFKGLDIRPTSDKVRESIFNLLGQDAEGLYVLDLFAGTGSLGIEALSRGANQSIFIDNSFKSLKLIKNNLERCKFVGQGLVIKKDLSMGLPRNRRFTQRPFDLIFIDPPYGREFIPPLLNRIIEMKLISENGTIITESQKKDNLPQKMNGLTLRDTKRYGETKIDRYVWEIKNG
jgi:16S rRNA (guanine(966)-N(2))-methyltransferase RsmD